MRRFARLVVVSIITLAGLLAPAVAAAFDLDTCTLTVTSKDGSGKVIDTATGGGSGGTIDDPLTVDPEGSVEWTGTDGGADLEGARWHVEIYGVPTPLQGEDRPGDDGGDGGPSTGSVRIGDLLPFDLVGVVFVSGAVEVGGVPVCAGAGWIELTGDATGTPGFIGAGIITLIGTGLVLTALRGRHIVRGGFGGILAGGGLATLSAIEGVLPFDKDTPAAVMIGSVLVGIAMGAIDVGSLFGGKAPPKPVAPTAPTVPAAAPPTPSAEPEAPTPVETIPEPTAPEQPVPTPPVEAAPPTPAAPPAVEPAVEPTVEPAAPDQPATASGPTAQERLAEKLSELPDEVRPQVEDLIRQAEAQVMAGGNEVVVSADTLSKLAKGYTSKVESITLNDGVIRATTTIGTATIDPGIDGNDRVVVSVKGLLFGNGTVARTLADLFNTIGDALAEKGHRIAGIIVEPSGMTIQTEPIPRN